MSEFEIGDIVQLKSGSPSMTVTRIIGEKDDFGDEILIEKQGLSQGDVVCAWFEGEDKKESGFAAQALQKVNES